MSLKLMGGRNKKSLKVFMMTIGQYFRWSCVKIVKTKRKMCYQRKNFGMIGVCRKNLHTNMHLATTHFSRQHSLLSICNVSCHQKNYSTQDGSMILCASIITNTPCHSFGYCVLESLYQSVCKLMVGTPKILYIIL